MATDVQSGNRLRVSRSEARGWIASIDRGVWRRFLLAILALTLALFLALSPV